MAVPALKFLKFLYNIDARKATSLATCFCKVVRLGVISEIVKSEKNCGISTHLLP